ncbi:unnamed protein product [Kluyveromyces dobzhanskii CBS 2104]|uniref:WGS project CCBQ000000000 data, contig 00016 n=1 Tax=Kluyveromyces dobzhanskii CBS 2104 TaxID=1427455 RepID=A0A0A8L1T8_9SACH|nr:unnamed protein product [Kluyveromyces dobzhanskii CBS 2104]
MVVNTPSLDELFESLNNLDLSNDAKLRDTTTKHSSDMNEIDTDELTSRFFNLSNVLDWKMLDLLQPKPEMSASSETAKAEGNNSNEIYSSFLRCPDPVSRTSYHFHRLGIEGKISSYEEKVNIEDVANANSANSLSLTRKINHQGDLIRGTTNQLPFTPGGLSQDVVETNSETTQVNQDSASKLLSRDKFGLFNVPPGLERGIAPRIQADIREDEQQFEEIDKLSKLDNDQENKEEVEQLRDLEYKKSASTAVVGEALGTSEIDELLPVDLNFGRHVRTFNSTEKTEWAHMVDLNSNMDNFDELVPNPARTWPFELDTFQKEAVFHLEQGDSVFVAAHTSAGKTVVAEYAIAMSKRNMTKTIYTSPIKALSNQKFRDFREDFDDVDVGLITGDVQINAEADCLIMTTEILRSMLYRGADLIRDVEFVIFDEVHYVNDQMRGVVWEEVIIMLPQHVKFILLSATVPNTFEFANWVGRTKQKNIYVISTPKRPVPLEVNIWAKKKLLPVINEKREFLPQSFREHKELLTVSSSSGPSKTSQKNGKPPGNQKTITKGSKGVGAKGSSASTFFRYDGASKSTWYDLLKHLRANDLLPAVVFVFSKKRCEEYADSIEAADLLSAKERSAIHIFIENSISRLRKDDRELPQIVKIRSLLSRGIAVHHGGLLPIVKELIEILFAKGFVKLLFATETFAMGLNLPTRTVVFSEIQKHDGEKKRYLLPGEFTQMAGRAGRRGKDKTGTVIVMSYSRPIDEASFKDVSLGVPTRLQSQFRLTYNMILNLLRIEALRVEEMIKFSFSENTKETLKPEQEKQITDLQHKVDSIDISRFSEEAMKDYESAYNLLTGYRQTYADIMAEIDETRSLGKRLTAGRFIFYRNKDGNPLLGLIVRVNPPNGVCTVLRLTKPMLLKDERVNYLPVLSFFMQYSRSHLSKWNTTRSVLDLEIEDISIFDIEILTKYAFSEFNNKLSNSNKEELETLIIEFICYVSRTVRKANEIAVARNPSLRVQQSVLQSQKIVSELNKLKVVKDSDFGSKFQIFHERLELQNQIKNIYHMMSEQNLNLLPDYQSRLSVLKETGFIDYNNNVLLKGRVACEINTGYELVLTELILDNFLGDFEPEEIVALLSAFVYEGRTKDEEPPAITPRLAKGKDKIREIYAKMQEVSERYQIPATQEEAEFLEKKRFALLNVIYEWARGLSFKEIMEMSVEAEGTIVRVISRLDEVCREVRNAAVIIGNSVLHQKMTQAQELIKRDIVFAASLYL